MAGNMGLFWVAGGGAVGAWCRYRVTARIAARYGEAFPCGTLFVNVLGSCLMGLFMAFAAPGELVTQGELAAGPWKHLLAEGFLGAFTTFSTFSVETVTAFSRGETGKACCSVALNLILCLSGLSMGLYLGPRLFA